jgi:CheY-like chemotaxis protein
MQTTVLALLADRDADSRQMYAEYLRQRSYEIDEAEDGREALAKAISRRPGVIVTESRLPGMSGFELCRLLRSDPSTERIPIIVVTADAFPSDVKLAKAAGAHAVLVKPCLPERLVEEIRAVLAQSYELRARGRAAHEKAAVHLARSIELIARSHAGARRLILSHEHQRRDTTRPPTSPPALVCPACDRPLRYVKSHVGGVSERHREQWDYFECATGCGTFQFRQRTRKIRRVG